MRPAKAEAANHSTGHRLSTGGWLASRHCHLKGRQLTRGSQGARCATHDTGRLEGALKGAARVEVDQELGPRGLCAGYQLTRRWLNHRPAFHGSGNTGQPRSERAHMVRPNRAAVVGPKTRLLALEELCRHCSGGVTLFALCGLAAGLIFPTFGHALYCSRPPPHPCHALCSMFDESFQQQLR